MATLVSPCVGIDCYSFDSSVERLLDHIHPFYVIGAITEGKRYFTHNTKQFEAVQGDMVFINPYEQHSCCKVPGQGFGFDGMHVDVEVMKRLCLSWPQQAANGASIFGSPLVRNKKITTMFSVLHKKAQTIPCSQFLAELTKVLECYFLEEQQEISFFTSACDIRVETARSYMHEHWHQLFALELLAQKVHLSKYHFVRTFTRQAKVSPQVYSKCIKVFKAQQLMRQGHSLSATATALAFYDQSHFIRAFKQVMGVTPGQYYKTVVRKKQNSG